MELSVLLAKDVQGLRHLLLGHDALVGFQRNGVRRLVIAQFYRGFDFDSGREGERRVLLDFCPLQGRHFNLDRHKTRLTDGLVVIIGNQFPDEIFLDHLGISLLKKRQGRFARAKAGDTYLSIQFDIGLRKLPINLIFRDFDFERSFIGTEFSNFEFHNVISYGCTTLVGIAE